MANIILDLEWNEPMTAAHGGVPPLKEIIQIGAVKLGADGGEEDRFRMLVRPERFPKIHWRVRKLTGLTTAKVAAGVRFPQAAEAFRRWCGPAPRLLTWGFDDIPVLLRNLQMWDLPSDWCGQWYNLQLIFCHQTEQGVRQRSLEFALEHYGMEKDLPLHDALNDAVYTARVCARLDLEEGLRGYPALSNPPRPAKKRVRPSRALKLEQEGLPSPQAALEDPVLGSVSCPRCGAALEDARPWLNVGHSRFFTVGTCPSHGPMQAWLRLRRQEDGAWTAVKEVTRGGFSARQYYEERAEGGPKKRRRTRSRSGGRGAEKERSGDSDIKK